MKRILLIAILVLCWSCNYAHAQHDDSISTEFVARARNVELRVPNSNTFTKDNLSYGFKIGYERCLGREGGRGDVCLGLDVAPTFHSIGESKLSLLTADYVMKWQANGNKKFQPFVAGTLGVACDHWKKKGPNSPTNTGCPALSYGGKVGFEVPFKEGDRKRWTAGVKVFATNFRNPLNGYVREKQFNVEAFTGVRW